MSDRGRSNNVGPSRTHTLGPRRPSPERGAASNPYTTLPPLTTEYVTLYIKLQRRRQCFRIVEVPTNYTFALLHTLLRFLFGLSDKRHYFEVVDHVIFHKQIRGQIHNSGRWSKFHQECQAEFIEFYPDMCGDSPVMRVSPVGTREDAPGYEKEWNWNMLDPDVVLKTSSEVTLGEVWNVDESENICAHTDCPRDCENEEIAIKYENTKGSDHSFFISLNRDCPFKSYKEPANLPVIVEAKGSCFSERGRDWRIEPEPHRKKVDRALKKPDAFSKYCEGKLHTFCTAEKLEVIDDEEFKRRDVAKRKEKEDRRERWQKKLGTTLVPVEDGRYSSSLDESGEEMSDEGF